MASTFDARLCVLVLCGTYFVVLAQDGGDIVNALVAHVNECGFHDWQVTDVGAKCGDNAPCSYPNSWCSNEGSLTCVTLPDACKNVLRNEVSASTTTTTAPLPTTQGSVTLPTDATTSQLFPVTEVQPTIPINPITLPSPGTDSGIRPLPVGPNGNPIVFFKVAGDLKPTCPDNSNFCCYWARNGECNDNAFFMQTYCRKSCQELRRGGPDAVGRPLRPGELITIGGTGSIGENAFGDPPGGTCQDLHPKCALWAQRGECKRNSLFMVSICRPSCGKCPPCLPQCQTVCSGPFPGNIYGGGGCQQQCTGCAGRK